MVYSALYTLLFLALITCVLMTILGGHELSHYGTRARLIVGNLEYPITGPVTDVGFPDKSAMPGMIWRLIQRLIHRRKHRKGQKYGEAINLSPSFPSLEGKDYILFIIVYDKDKSSYRLEDTREAEITLTRNGKEIPIPKGGSLLQNGDEIHFQIPGKKRHLVTFRMGERRNV